MPNINIYYELNISRNTAINIEIFILTLRLVYTVRFFLFATAMQKMDCVDVNDTVHMVRFHVCVMHWCVRHRT